MASVHRDLARLADIPRQATRTSICSESPGSVGESELGSSFNDCKTGTPLCSVIIQKGSCGCRKREKRRDRDLPNIVRSGQAGDEETLSYS